MAHFEKRLSSETKFEGRVITVTLDRVELENGGTSTREVVHHHGGAGIAALNLSLIHIYPQDLRLCVGGLDGLFGYAS